MCGRVVEEWLCFNGSLGPGSMVGLYGMYGFQRAQINWRCLVRVVEFDDVPERGLRAEVLRAADLAPRGAGKFCSMALANYYPHSYTFCLDIS